jgi:two-component system, OmpR family, phosphate regulon sensor histidine kinase PhoR
VLLMVLTIVVITGFQAYWLNKNYDEEKRLFTGQTNILFRETLVRLQASKLKLDSNFNIKLRQKESVINMVNVLRTKAKDSSEAGVARVTAVRGMGGSVMISVDSRKDSGLRRMDTTIQVFRRQQGPGTVPGHPVFDFLVGVDSLQDSITVKEVVNSYQKALLLENIVIPFTVTKTQGPSRENFMIPPPDPNDNKVTLGFTKPVTFQVDFENTSWYLLKKLSQPILVSALLVGVTIFSFLLMYRNIVRQRRLTQLKNDFISNITHELKTPIATVSVAIEALRNFNALDDPMRTREYLDISANELQRLSLLVDKVLKLSMFEKREIELKKEPFDLKELVTEVMSTMKLLFDKHHAKVNFTATGFNFIIEADKLHLTSVVYNLLDNALKYSKEDPVINVELSLLANDILELKVNDNGIGIPHEFLFKIFTKFFRVPTGDKHNIKGYGLGLSYVSEVIKRHMGFIVVESELGKGSTFIVKVPVREAGVIYFDENRQIRAYKKFFKL